MRIYTKIDRNLVIQQYERQLPLVFIIAWEHERKFYPSQTWTDFGLVVIGWWVQALDRLLDNNLEKKTSFSFMDGPYEIIASYYEQSQLIELMPQGKEYIWVTSVRELINVLLSAMEEIKMKLLEFGVYTENDDLVLQKGRQVLSKYL